MNTVKWNLSKYARWEEGKWTLNNDPSKVLALIIQELQLMVIQDDMLLESVSLAQSSNKIKSVYKQGTLVVAVKCEGYCSKFRILFSSLADGEKCVNFLKKYIQINHPEGKQSADQTLPEMLASALKNGESITAPSSIPEEYPLEDAIKLCILDPGFPKLVGKVENILKKMGYQDKD